MMERAEKLTGPERPAFPKVVEAMRVEWEKAMDGHLPSEVDVEEVARQVAETLKADAGFQWTREHEGSFPEITADEVLRTRKAWFSES